MNWGQTRLTRSDPVTLVYLVLTSLLVQITENLENPSEVQGMSQCEWAPPSLQAAEDIQIPHGVSHAAHAH